MIPSKFLRLIISRNHKINLKEFSWTKEFETAVFHMDFYDDWHKISLKAIFNDGYNIGNCLLTSYYVSKAIEDSLICTGKVEILKGTKNSPNGDHVWVENEDYIIDTTLMIKLPKKHKYAKYYHKDSCIQQKNTKNDISYEDDKYFKEKHADQYYLDLFSIK